MYYVFSIGMCILVASTCSPVHPYRADAISLLQSWVQQIPGDTTAPIKTLTAWDESVESCKDKKKTGYLLHKASASCKQLAMFCHDQPSSARIQTVCPKTCGTCPKTLSPLTNAIIQQFDHNGDQQITSKELYHVLHAADPATWDKHSVERLLASLDTDGDGLLGFDEFNDWLVRANIASERDHAAADAANTAEAAGKTPKKANKTDVPATTPANKGTENNSTDVPAEESADKDKEATKTDVPATNPANTGTEANSTNEPTEESPDKDKEADETDVPATAPANTGTEANSTDVPTEESPEADGTDVPATNPANKGTEANSTDVPTEESPDKHQEADETDAPATTPSNKGTEANSTDVPTEESPDKHQEADETGVPATTPADKEDEFDVDLKIAVDPLAACQDNENSGFRIAGVKVNCSMLGFMCKSTKYGARLAKSCPRTCSACGSLHSSMKCEDTTGLSIDGMPVTCENVAPLCNVTPSNSKTKKTLRTIRDACPITCGTQCNAGAHTMSSVTEET